MTGARYRRKPTEAEAICWNGQNLGSVQEFASGALGIGTVEGGALPLWVAKSSAVCRVEHGDWIIREPDGSGFYPCAGDVFAATYEPASEPLTSAQCERLRQVAAEWGDALSAVRDTLEYAAERIPTLKGAEIIAAAREALKVLEGGEEEGRG